MSRLRDRRHRHDRFFRKARAESYASRAVYKLEEIDTRFGLLQGAKALLDLGCRPGSWLQYAAERMGGTGRIVGIDRQPLDIALPANVTVLVGDIFETSPETLRQGLPHFDVVLSDMAPDTTGVRSVDAARMIGLYERTLALTDSLLRPGGHFVAKIFIGEGFDDAVRETKARFKKVKVVRPEGTRKGSKEQYVVGTTRR